MYPCPSPNTNPRGAFTHPLCPRYVPLLLVYPPRPLRTFAPLNAHLQVHLGLGGKPRSGLRPHSLNRAASPCCGLRTSSGRFDALAVQRKAMRCPSAAISQRYCSKHPPQLCQRSSGMQTAACIGRVRNALRRSWANQVLRMAIGLRPQGASTSSPGLRFIACSSERRMQQRVGLAHKRLQAAQSH